MILPILEDELTFTASPSSGPGGQNVNKTSTRITLHFDVDSSPNLSAEQKARLRHRLATRIDKRGILRVVSQKHRTQAANKKEAIDRFHELVRSALKTRPPRKPTRISKAAKERRLEEKTRRSRIKSLRSPKIRRED